MPDENPFQTVIEFQTGVISPAGDHAIRRLSDIKTIFRNRDAAEKTTAGEDPTVYEVYNIPVPEETGQLQHCTSVIHPGLVGDEYHMTKGHYHARRDTAEIYLCLHGEGILLMETEDGRTAHLRMSPGTMSYIPPFWAHRSVNTGDVPLVFVGVYPGDAGHDYGSVERIGFRQRVVKGPDGPRVVAQEDAVRR